MNGGGKLPAQGTHRAACRLDGIGIDQVSDAFRLRQIKFIVEKGAARKFARLRQPRSQIETALQHQLHHGGTAVPLQLKHVLAGVGMRGGKKQGDTLIQGVAIFVQKIAVGGTPRNGLFAQNFARQDFDALPGYSHHPDAAAPLRSGNGGNGINAWLRHPCSHPRRHG